MCGRVSRPVRTWVLLNSMAAKMTTFINGVEIEDTFAEAFGMWCGRVIITAADRKWAREAANKMTGFATSIIACGCEAGIESDLDQTPDGRPGVSVLIFAPGKDLARAPHEGPHRPMRFDMSRPPPVLMAFPDRNKFPSAARCAFSAILFRSASSSQDAGIGASPLWKVSF